MPLEVTLTLALPFLGFVICISLYFSGGYSQKDRPPLKLHPPYGVVKRGSRDWLVPHGTVVRDRRQTFHLPSPPSRGPLSARFGEPDIGSVALNRRKPLI